MRLPRHVSIIQCPLQVPVRPSSTAPAIKGLQPKTIDAYARAIRRIGAYFNYQLDDLFEAQLLDYFTDLLHTHSWSAVKLDLYGLKFFYTHVLKKPWVALDLVKPPQGTAPARTANTTRPSNG